MPVNVWDQVLSRVETKVNRHSYYTWFKPTSFISDSGSVITVQVPDALFKDWLGKHYTGVLTEVIGELGRAEARVQFVPQGTLPPEVPSTEIEGPSVPPSVAGGLNTRYTFDAFIVGSSNQFAHAACRAVAEAPSRSYNPLFIHGGF